MVSSGRFPRLFHHIRLGLMTLGIKKVLEFMLNVKVEERVQKKKEAGLQRQLYDRSEFI